MTYIIGSGGTLQRGDDMRRVITYTVTGVDFTGSSVVVFEASSSEIKAQLSAGFVNIDGDTVEIYVELASAYTSNLVLGRNAWFSLKVTTGAGDVDVLPRIWLEASA